MPTHCPACGAENPDFADFCNLCHRSMGFEAPEYTSSGQSAEGYGTNYPSSFDEGAPASPPPDQGWAPPPQAAPVDTGAYGATSGYQPQPPQQPQYYAPPPVDVGQYGAQSGAGPAGPFGPYDAYGHSPGFYQQPVEIKRVSRFEWGDALLKCLYAALFAGVLSGGLEIMFSFIGVGYASEGHITIAYIWILLSLLIPCLIAGYFPAYKLEEHGWQLGLISVGMWAFIFRPLYLAFLGWILTESFNFKDIVLNKWTLIFTFCVFLPLGALAGWLAEKRATTGLKI